MRFTLERQCNKYTKQTFLKMTCAKELEFPRLQYQHNISHVALADSSI
jgi:hypothetical protein